MTVPAAPALSPTASPPGGPRLIRTRLLLIRIGAALLTVQLLLNAAAGPLGIATGKVPHPMLLAALLAPVGKLLALGPVAVIAWTAGRSATAVRLWLLGLLAEIVAAVAVRQAGSALSILLQLVVFGGVLVLLIPDRRRLLPGRPELRPWFAPAAVLGGLSGAWFAVLAASAPAPAASVAADDVAEIRFDVVLVGVALCAWFLAGFLAGLVVTSSRAWTAPAVAAVLAGAACLAMPSGWAAPGIGPATLLLAAAAAVVVAGTRRREEGPAAA